MKEQQNSPCHQGAYNPFSLKSNLFHSTNSFTKYLLWARHSQHMHTNTRSLALKSSQCNRIRMQLGGSPHPPTPCRQEKKKKTPVISQLKTFTSLPLYKEPNSFVNVLYNLALSALWSKCAYFSTSWTLRAYFSTCLSLCHFLSLSNCIKCTLQI